MALPAMTYHERPAADVKMPSMFTASIAAMYCLPGYVLCASMGGLLLSGQHHLPNHLLQATKRGTTAAPARRGEEAVGGRAECRQQHCIWQQHDSLLPPAFIHLVGSNLAPAATRELQRLLQQLQILEDVFAGRLRGCSVNDEYEEQQQEQQGSTAGRGSRAASCSAGTSWPVLVLGDVQGLPCMPTLNGWLLDYPAVYWVQDYDEAVAASEPFGVVC